MGDGLRRENEEKEEKMGGSPLDERGDHISDLVQWHTPSVPPYEIDASASE
jgi:hypothetical protein